MSEPVAASPGAIEAYFIEHYLTVAAVAAKSGVTSDRVLALEEAGCIPGHTHEWREGTTVAGSFGEFHFPGSVTRYYHPSVVDWVKQAATWPDDVPLSGIADKMRARFAAELTTALDGREPPWPDPVDYAWAYILDGTWGACLREIKPESMLTKEYARKAIRDIRAENREPTSVERTALKRHVEDYERVAMPFAPHEIPTCSRTREVLPAIRDWGLADTGSTGG